MTLRRLSSSALAAISFAVLWFAAFSAALSDPVHAVKSPLSGSAAATNSAPGNAQASVPKGDVAAKAAPAKKLQDAPVTVKTSAGSEANKVTPAIPASKEASQPTGKKVAAAAGQSSDKTAVPAKVGGKDAAVPASASAGKAKTGEKAGEKSNETKTETKTETNTAPKPSGTNGHKHSANREQLIPPPPPVQPSLLMGPEFGGIPFMFDGMNKDELGVKAKDLGQQLKDMQDVLKEKQDHAQELKDKAARFKPLFEEGVVSRHELEAAEKEAVDADREVDRINRRLSEFQTQKQTVDSRLKDLSKKSASTPAASRGKKKKH
jgi:hypothetical protein